MMTVIILTLVSLHQIVFGFVVNKVNNDNLELATLQIASKRLLLNDVIEAIEGVFFSFPRFWRMFESKQQYGKQQDRKQ